MSTHSRVVPAAVPVAVREPFHISILAAVLAISGALLLSGCMGAERSIVAGPNPADPAAPVPVVGYRSTTASYVSQRPVVPVLRRRQNERVAPQPKSEQ